MRRASNKPIERTPSCCALRRRSSARYTSAGQRPCKGGCRMEPRSSEISQSGASLPREFFRLEAVSDRLARQSCHRAWCLSESARVRSPVIPRSVIGNSHRTASFSRPLPREFSRPGSSSPTERANSQAFCCSAVRERASPRIPKIEIRPLPYNKPIERTLSRCALQRRSSAR